MATTIIKARRNTCDYDDCGHSWITTEIPDRCAKCKRRRWNKGGSVEQIDAALAEKRSKRGKKVA